MAATQELHRLIDMVPEADLPIAEKFLRANTPEERRAVIAEGRRALMLSGPKSVMARASSRLPYAKEIEEKSTEIAALSDKVGLVRAQISAASVQCEAAKARISALKARREDLIRDRETLPSRVRDACLGLGLDIELRRTLQLEREQKAKNIPKNTLK